MITYTINERVLLAGQPEPEDWQRLVEQGYRNIINIRGDEGRAAIQARNAEEAGLEYLHLSVPAYELEPPHLAEFNRALAHAGDNKVVIHCRTASRVALLWMLNRIQYEGWTQEQAEAELRAAGYDTDSMDTFTFCAEDYFERAAELQPAHAAEQ
jgi:uncharacterized protein (TIGR01244 family)